MQLKLKAMLLIVKHFQGPVIDKACVSFKHTPVIKQQEALALVTMANKTFFESFKSFF